MSSFEVLDALREQNKTLLKRLQEQTEKLNSLCVNTIQETSVGGTAEMVQQLPLAEKNGDVITNVVIRSHPVRARVALSNLSIQTQEPPVSRATITESLGEACKTSTPFQNDGHQQQKQPDQTEEDLVYSRLLRNYGNFRRTGTRENNTASLKSILKQDSFRREAGRVAFQSPGQELPLTPDRHRVQPLLGYDWIAGLLDADSSLTERSEQFFSELRNFRQVNRDECVHSQPSGPIRAETATSPLKIDKSGPQSIADSHQCTFCYRINSRLFATPLDPQVGCPVCKMPKPKHPHTVSEPAFIRVSIPRSTLLPAYRYKAHRRSSFDPSDSLGLPSHCLSGWSNIAPSTTLHMSCLDLRGSMAPAGDSSASPDALMGRSGDLLDVSRLARYRFQHTHNQPRPSLYPVY